MRVLEAGRSSIVRARSQRDGREVIVKLLDPASEPLLPRRFDRRRRALLRLSRADVGLVPLLDHGTATDGRDFVAIPDLPLGSLQDQIDRGPTPWFPASQLVAKVSETVGLLHQEDVVLGDLRPSKILLQTPDTPLVSAFGMASRRFDDGGSDYRAPEAGNDDVPNAAADVYSLALILATLIGGRSPARDEPVSDLLAEVGELVPPRILDVLEHGLSDSLTNRYHSAVALHRALQRAIEADPSDELDGLGAGTDDDAHDDEVDLDELLTAPVAAPPDPTDGLPADVGDIGFAAEAPAATIDPIETDGDERLLLPPGLDDIVLAPAGPAANGLDDQTTPFPDVDLDDQFDLDGPDAEADGGLARGSEPGTVDPAPAAETTTDVATGVVDPDVIDLAEQAAISGEIDLTERATITGEIDLTDDGRPPGAPVPAADDHTLALETDGADNADSADNAAQDGDGLDDGPSDGGGLADESDDTDDDEIVDLTELFTRTQEFVYDPDAIGNGDRADGGTPAPTDLPGGPVGPTTTLLRGQHPPVAAPQEPVAARADATSIDAERPAGSGEAAIAAPAPPTMPARPSRPTPPAPPTPPGPTIDDDQTEVFADPSLPGHATSPAGNGTVPGALPAAAPGNGGLPFGLADDGSANGSSHGLAAPPVTNGQDPESIPFPNMARVRDRTDDHRLLARARVRAELFWFRSRRRVSSALAVLGMITIAAIVLFFAAREIRSTANSVSTEGVPQPSLTTATTSVNYQSTDAPFITDVPLASSTTSVTVRRRPTVAPTSTTEATTTEAPTTAPETTAPPRTRRTTTEPETTRRTTTEPPTTEETTTTRRRGRPTTTRRTTTTEATTTTRRTTTTEATTTTRRTTTEAPTTTGDVLPPTTEEEDDAQLALPASPIPTLVALGQRSASITYGSDECVATRFRLVGSDGSVQSGSSRGYDAEVQCSSAWNLDFSGGSALASGVAYTLTVTVKNGGEQAASASLDFTTPV